MCVIRDDRCSCVWYSAEDSPKAAQCSIFESVRVAFCIAHHGVGPLGKYAAKVRKAVNLQSVAKYVGFVDLLLLCYFCMWDPNRVLQLLEVLASNHAELVVRLPAALLQAGHKAALLVF